ncbi:scarecrow-like protein 30 [Silene latifolia]|uniref:scarecrow-like protein 30 n=1 Tax=Silene latifolia TaxID=37657 RepID=UPI003D7876B0
MNFIPSNGYGYPEECINVDMQNDFMQNFGFVHNNMSLNDQNYSFLYENSYPNEAVVPDFSDDYCLKFINDILMEEDLDDHVPATLQDYHALQATEKALYDALGDTLQSPSRSSDVVESSAGSLESGYVGNDDELLREVQKFIALSSNGKNTAKEAEKRKMDMLLEERNSKQIAASNEEYVEMKNFDDILICEEGKDDISPFTRKNAVTEVEKSLKPKDRRRKSGRGKRKPKEEVVDLRNLLIECAQAVTSADLVTANELLKQIRQHASAYGDSAQRVAYYFANGLEARMAGTGSDLYRDFVGKPISSVQILKGYQLYVSAVPFQRTTYFLANQAIAKLADKSAKVHIIDFGIFLGFQWPGLIQQLSRRRIGPPRVRITGVDYPHPGFKPAQKTQETGNRLSGYGQRFGVPFEFNAIAQMWNTLKLEDFKIEKDELVIVSCLYQSGKLSDEGIDVDSPRDYFLKLIRKLNPDMFIHGVVNGTFNAPFFTTRFREALYHYSALFDVFEATMPRENDERLLIEQLLYGKDAMNIVACEGSERIERPESYKQWQMRHHRVGFTQVGLDTDVIHRARAMVKANYHKDFMVELDRDWMVQGWKGRILSAVSCWKPA